VGTFQRRRKRRDCRPCNYSDCTRSARPIDDGRRRCNASARRGPAGVFSRSSCCGQFRRRFAAQYAGATRDFPVGRGRRPRHLEFPYSRPQALSAYSGDGEVRQGKTEGSAKSPPKGNEALNGILCRGCPFEAPSKNPRLGVQARPTRI